MDTSNTGNAQKRKFVEAISPQPRTQTEYTRRVRSISRSDAFLAVEWLNATKGTPAHRRALKIMGELASLRKTLDFLRKPKPADISEWTKRAQTQEEFRRRHNAFNKLLARRYLYVPALAYDLKSGYWHFGTLSKRQRGRVIALNDSRLTIRVDESGVVAALLRLAANRELYKVRLCENCRESWLVCNRPTLDRFHSSRCRESYYAKSPEYHDRKAHNQRTYRARLRRARRANLT